mmetsp:Transcript_26257/g.61540  ORF Transcript_26257/g.61540 Transcript_26257/m.61540 type:complete len:138 (-) Transcript_26257:536-949(-)
MGGCYSCFGEEYGIVATCETDSSENSEKENSIHNREGMRSPPVKATIVHGYKDKSLYKTMQECRDVRKGLRRVEDPDIARREKKKHLALQNLRCKIKGKDTSEGYLGMTPGNLQVIRKSLRQVDRDATSSKPRQASE